MRRYHFRSVKVHRLLILILALWLPLVAGQAQDRGEAREAAQARAPQIAARLQALREAMVVQDRHTVGLMQSLDIVGTATALGADGQPEIRVMTARPDVRGIPKLLDGVRVKTQVTGRYYALECEATGDGLCETSERWPRPVPTGVSIGHPLITAGTFGARVTDGMNVFILSNNHVMANSNQAIIGDPIWQPGAFDGGAAEDVIANLSDFQVIEWCQVIFIWVICQQTNTIDAAIALSTTAELGAATPGNEPYVITPGYGAPSTIIHPAYGDPNTPGDEQWGQLQGLAVQKYGRTTELTQGTIDGVNATIDVNYGSAGIARFVNQLVIIPGAFSGGGDSGSLIVTDDGVRNPVGLLFAGSTTTTIANPIEAVLQRFAVTIDDGGSITPVTDIAVTDVSVPGNPVVGVETDVAVTVRNVGNQDVGGFNVALTDDGTPVGTQGVNNLVAGASTVLSFTWIPASAGPHTLNASHDFGAEEPANPSNDAATTQVTVLEQPVSGPQLQLWEGFASTDAWTTVTLGQDYANNMVVVCTPNYDRFGLGPAVVRIRNATGSSFEVGLARPWFGAIPGDDWSANVHCMIVLAGIYNQAEHGVTMEAVRLSNFTVTDNSRSWVGVPQAYANAYTTPVVVGQVIGATGAVPGEIGDWTVFWARGSSRNQPPSAGALYVGRHTGEDPNPRPAEAVAYVVIEAGNGTMGEIAYAAGLGADTVRGVTNAPPYAYGLSGVPTPSTGILSQAGMDGVNGGWAILYGTNPVTNGAVNMAIEEDWYFDPERNHTTEQVGYIVFD